ncbi:glycoside hydrolase family 36 protein [Dothidotthia symphoricarpi CBS 119687]|uniref:Glycoside hydrolase family 36 protein n=1 Tax=Dothidotthia symphoricarpi CBS 119687 TaxID=1392245 RepID=A0A6A6AK74_9PLEO|nr:glycoside hydrolase family 36 protein [Dothidotthia symphoricarpi CBS 119687]KAF2132220.1 glycoside hydrolase family 36 protein [Dothidotthia symphoricarpi CBS 119687]
MYATLTCHPPLGQTTVVGPEKDSVRFTVLLESSAGSQKDWEVALWHNFENDDKWTSSSLTSSPETTLTATRSSSTDVRQQFFTIELPGRPKNHSSLSYTFTFRAAKDESWKWANEQLSTSDGRILYQSGGSLNDDLTHYIEGLPSFLQIGKEQSDSPETLLWSITSPVNAASGTQSGLATKTLGRPTSYSRWFALVRLWSPWLAPRHGRDRFQPDKEAILSAFERDDGSHLVVLAVSGVDNVMTTLQHDGEGSITIISVNDSEKDGISRLVAAVGKSLDHAVAAVMYHARRLVMQYGVVPAEIDAEMKTLADDFKPEWLENWYDGLSYCTWNGLGQHLNEQKLFDALESLSKHEINISNLIIDDNWQSLNHEGGDQFNNAWMEFEATKIGFPRGLEATVSDIRSKYKHVRHIAVWHALFGYWGGIAPEGKIAQEYKTTVVQKKKGVSGGKTTVVAEEDVGRFYKDFYQFLSSAGIDSVKTDAQFFLDELEDATDRRQLIRSYQDAWNINQLRYFSARSISCMSQTPQIIFHSQLPSNRPRILLRNSDDFFPEVPASHPWHIFCNAHNSILNQYLNILPDWDMFQTSHDYASFHAAGRCVSGGPIYITDVPGQHDIDLIAQMTGNTPRGDTVILRPQTVGKSTAAYNSYDDPVLLKVSTYVGSAHSGVSILGVFNCTQQPLVELVGLDAFPGAEKGMYIIRDHTSGQITKPTSSDTGNAFVHLELPTRGWEILSAFPLQQFKLQRQHPAKGPDDITVANLGILGKMTGPAAIINSSSNIDIESGRLRIWTSLKVLGTYGLYISNLKERNLEDDFFAVIFGRPIPFHCIKISDVCDEILEIDTVRAWKETDSKASWSNEVAVEVVIR